MRFDSREAKTGGTGECDGSGEGIAVSIKTGEATVWVSYTECVGALDRCDYFIVRIVSLKNEWAFSQGRPGELFFYAPTFEMASAIKSAYQAFKRCYYDLVEYHDVAHEVPPTTDQIREHEHRHH